MEGFSRLRATDGASSRLPLIGARTRVVTGLLVTLAIGVFIAWVLTRFPFANDYSRGLGYGLVPDIWHERVTAWEAIWGDPFRSLAVMMPEHGYPGSDGVSPRTPAAFLMQLPLLFIPEGALMPVVTSLIVLGTVAIIGLAARVSGVGLSRLVWVGPLLMFSFPVITAIAYGSLSVVVMVILLLLSWANKDKAWAGIPLGVAMASRLWPGLIVVGFWISGRRKAAYQALAVFVLLNLAGLALPGVSLTGSIRVLSEGGSVWVDHNQNASLSYLLLGLGVPVVLSVAATSGIALLTAKRYPEKAIPICVIGGLIASPLSWPTYSLAALPVVVLAWRSRSSMWQVITVVAILPSIAWVQTPTSWKGYLGFATLLLLLLTVVRPEESQPKATTTGVRVPTSIRGPTPIPIKRL